MEKCSSQSAEVNGMKQGIDLLNLLMLVRACITLILSFQDFFRCTEPVRKENCELEGNAARANPFMEQEEHDDRHADEKCASPSFRSKEPSSPVALTSASDATLSTDGDNEHDLPHATKLPPSEWDWEQDLLQVRWKKFRGKENHPVILSTEEEITWALNYLELLLPVSSKNEAEKTLTHTRNGEVRDGKNSL